MYLHGSQVGWDSMFLGDGDVIERLVQLRHVSTVQMEGRQPVGRFSAKLKQNNGKQGHIHDSIGRVRVGRGSDAV